MQDHGSKGSSAAVVAGFLGWTLDAFDFFLVVMTFTAIAAEFHKTDVQMAWAITLTLAFRPVGAFIFGLIADRYGRRVPLMLDLLLFSVIEVLSGLARNYTQFLVLRAIFGIAMGGEWGVGTSLAMEKVPARLRGIFSGLLQEGYAAGYLLAAIAYMFIFPHWGWRVLFFIGGLPALLALFVRFGVSESEVWQQEKAANWSELTTAIFKHWPIFLYLIALMTMMNLSSHGTQDLYPTFLQRDRGFGVDRKSQLTALSMVGAICGGIVFGYFSDRIGRRRAMVFAFIGAILIVPLWALPRNLWLLMAGAFSLQFMVQGAWGVIPAHISELSPPGIRGFMPGFAYQIGNLLAACIAVLETEYAKRFGYGHTLAFSAVIIFIVAAIVTSMGGERRAVMFGAPHLHD